ncbi:uncharacterized protein SEPMUDRAFT_108424 [Sphaerulina musiva SO2202]|uniref:Myb-like domain-containing protein n=1 Tax=Sphaerulina musiva (strain SO2202) TaxID=692275 RepID=M3CGR4_SPHMS|nr:uncharacterized protein SEPMUDRAFT_108424 [Sphaerulina musiva SO2202]EMF12998.1 hypothetical protein SEPMUDRAFT_108424 [Sphaerulina musiva SO2202]
MPRALLVTPAASKLITAALDFRMTEDTPKRAVAGAWTDADKLDLLLSIIDSSVDKIEWKSVQCPEGRTIKACQVWLDKQRSMLKKLKGLERGGGGEEDGDQGDAPKTPAKSKASMAEGDGDEAMPTAKKARTPRKAKTPAKVNAGVDSEEDASKSAEPESGGVGEQVTGVAEGEEMAV